MVSRNLALSAEERGEGQARRWAFHSLLLFPSSHASLPETFSPRFQCEFDVGLQDTRQPIVWLLRETRGQSGVVATCNIFSREGLSVPLPTSTWCISLLQVVKKGPPSTPP